MTQAAGISFDPTTFVEGGLIDDFDGVVTEARFVLWDYDGKVQEPVLALRLTIQTDASEAPVVQHYSAGDTKYFVPSEDGTMLLPVGSKTAMNSNTNTAQLLSALVNAGFDRNVMAQAGNILFLEGVNAHWQRVAQPKRTGLTFNSPEGGQQRDKTVLLPVKLLGTAKAGGAAKATAAKTAAPKAAAAAPKAAAAPAPAAAAAGSDDLDEKLQPIVMGIIAESGPTTKQKLSAAVFKAMNGDGDRNKGMKRVAEQSYIDAAVEAGWLSNDDGTLSLAE
jgi:hypothetical protein